MERIIEKNKKLLKEILLYGIIGCISAGTDTVCFILMRRMGISILFSNILGVHIGMAISFCLNSKFTFKVQNNSVARLMKFFMVGYLGMGISTILLLIGTTCLGINEVYVKLGSVLIVAAIQFVLNKLLTFKEGKTSA